MARKKLKTSHKATITIAVVAAVLGIAYGVNHYTNSQVSQLRKLVSSSFHIGARTKTAGCKVANAMPDHACTPGAIFPTVTKDQVCTSGYSSTVRNVPTSEKDQVYAEYGIITHTAGQYEVDHDISLELGGSNDIANLWPEAANPTPGFHQKDEVENYLHQEVCNGQISLTEAQELISAHWLDVYKLLHP